MLSVPASANVRREHRRVEADLGAHSLVLVHASEALLEPASPLQDLAPDQDAARTRGESLALEKLEEQDRGPEEPARRRARRMDEVRATLMQPAVPTVPPLGWAVDHARLRMGVQEADLVLQFPGQPDIVRV